MGSRRLKLVGFYFSILLLVFALIELNFPAKSAYISMSTAMTTFSFLLSVCMSAAFNLLAALYTFRRAEEYEDAFEAEHERSERLLLNLMPASIAERLKQDPDGLIADDDVTPIGKVITGAHEGRGDAEVTIFDGTGVGLQDLAEAAAVVDLASRKGIAQEVEI